MNKAWKKWFDKISIDELPEPYDLLVELIGIENVVKLALKMGGTTVYLPKIDTLFRKVRDKKICASFTGENYAKLAKKYGITERRVRTIVNRELVRKYGVNKRSIGQIIKNSTGKDSENEQKA